MKSIILLIVVLGTELCQCVDMPWKHGMYAVAGYGAHKKAIKACGGNAQDLAVGMLEGPLTGTGYPYGDNKKGDAANFGIFKQNWWMIRQSRSEWSHLGPNDYDTGKVLNTDVCMDVATLHKSQEHFGMDKWFTFHRAGSSGHPTDKTVVQYRQAIEWIKEQINSNPGKYESDDTRIWVDVPAI